MTMRIASCVIPLFGICVLAQCHAPDRRSPRLEDLNIVLIVVDTLSARHLGCYNDEISFTPNIDKLARDGVLFSRPYSTTSWTQPAMASLFTSLTNESHGLQEIDGVLAPSFETLAEILQSKGYKTAGIISSPVLTKEKGFAQGFDTYLQENRGGVLLSGIPITSHKVSDRSIAWLKANSEHFDDSKFFLFLHYFDPHSNYQDHRELSIATDYKGKLTPGMMYPDILKRLPELTQDDVNYLISLYNEEIAYTDQHIGRLLSYLEESHLIEDTLIILTADHGEEFLQHDYIGRCHSLYEELIHVPLIFHAPKIFPSHTVDAPVSILDVVPTIFGLSRKPIERPAWKGVSLLPYLLDPHISEGHRDVFSSVAFVNPFDPLDPMKNAHKTALVNGTFKLIHDKPSDTWELYDLADDPMEQKSLSETMPTTLSTMVSRVRWFENRQIDKSGSDEETHLDLSADEIKQLRSLGYIQ